MTTRRYLVGLAIGTILTISMCLPGSVRPVTAETLKYRLFNHVTKAEVFSIPDVEGHEIAVTVREGVNVFENGELAWLKGVATRDGTKTDWKVDQYVTMTFNDGSTIMIHSKGTGQAATAGGPGVAKWSGEIYHGTGRFEGIKGTQTSSGKLLPVEKGELGGKSLGESTLEFTLPPK